MSCSQCGAACQGGLCKQCEVENANAHLANEVATGDPWDHEDETEGDDE